MKVKQLRHELEAYNQEGEVFIFLRRHDPTKNAYGIDKLVMAWGLDDKPCVMIDTADM